MKLASSTPDLLIYSSDLGYYVEELRRQYNGRKIITPDGYKISFYLNQDVACTHAICGKGKDKINYARAQRITYIEFILMDDTVRVVRQDKITNNICFVSRQHSYIVVCSVVRNKELKFISQFYDQSRSNSYIDKFDDRSKYKYL